MLSLTIGIKRRSSNAGTCGRRSTIRRRGATRPVILTGASGHPDFRADREPTTLFRWGLYLSPMAGSCSLSWPFSLTKQPSELSKIPPTHLHHRFIIFVRLGVNPSVLLEGLYLEALGDYVLLWDSLVSLRGCHHLDGLVQQGSSSKGR
jgi:hypothetical protein